MVRILAPRQKPSRNGGMDHIHRALLRRFLASPLAIYVVRKSSRSFRGGIFKSRMERADSYLNACPKITLKADLLRLCVFRQVRRDTADRKLSERGLARVFLICRGSPDLRKTHAAVRPRNDFWPFLTFLKAPKPLINLTRF